MAVTYVEYRSTPTSRADSMTMLASASLILFVKLAVFYLAHPGQWSSCLLGNTHGSLFDWLHYWFSHRNQTLTISSHIEYLLCCGCWASKGSMGFVVDDRLWESETRFLWFLRWGQLWCLPWGDVVPGSWRMELRALADRCGLVFTISSDGSTAKGEGWWKGRRKSTRAVWLIVVRRPGGRNERLRHWSYR